MPMKEPDFTPARVATAVLIAVGVLVASAAVVSAQVGIVALGVFGLAGAAARIAAPLRRSFIVRSKTIDAAFLAVLGTALIYLGLATPLG